MMFFTPSFIKSVVHIEKLLARKERINYLQKLAFGTSLNDLLD